MSKMRKPVDVDPDKPTKLASNGGSPSDELASREFDGYRVERRIGEGGMGVVYRATQPALGDRPVAMKLIADELASEPSFRKRFERESASMAKLNHPNIATVLGRGEVDGRPYLVMEYVRGKSLRAHMKKGSLSPDQALSILRAMLDALDHAHGHRIVHRDIKPENVLIASDGRVCLTDFGLALEIGEATRLTRTKFVLGTYEYMAPEQREDPKSANAQSDVYATTAVLYEMLTGKVPIGRFEAPSRLRPRECGRRLDELIDRGLARDPRDRYRSAAAMRKAVLEIVERPARTRCAKGEAVPATAATRAATDAVGLRLRNLVKYLGAKPCDGTPAKNLQMIGKRFEEDVRVVERLVDDHDLDQRVAYRFRLDAANAVYGEACKRLDYEFAAYFAAENLQQ